jgi:hypothetical protein
LSGYYAYLKQNHSPDVTAMILRHGIYYPPD